MPQFDISVIIPVYNSEDYLEQTLQSVTKQTHSFEKTQVILIDDGSSDKSWDICEQFARNHPVNVIAVHQNNSGVSAARNRGLEIANGNIIAFLDSDDMWSPESFETALRFFSEHEDVDVLCGKLTLFERSESEHPLSYKFEDTSIVDLTKTPHKIQSTIGNCFFRKAAISNTRFETAFSTSEDTLFVNCILLSKCKYGVSEACNYLYRKRLDNSSLSQRKDPEKHLQNLDVCIEMFRYSEEKYGEIPPFIQATALYILNWQLFGKTDKPFTSDETLTWHKKLKRIVTHIEDDTICSAPWLNRICRIYLMTRRHGSALFENISWKDDESAMFGKLKVCSLNVKTSMRVYEVSLKQRKYLHLEGTTDLCCFYMPFALYAKNKKGDIFDASLTDFPTRDKKLITGETAFPGKLFKFDLPLAGDDEYSFYVSFAPHPRKELRLFPRFDSFAKFNYKNRHNYVVFDNVLIRLIRGKFIIRPYSKSLHFTTEAKRALAILRKNRKFPFLTRLKYLFMRTCFYLIKIWQKKPIWLFADKEWKAGDNGENVYRYAIKQSGFHDAKMLFVLKQQSVDYPSVCSYGTVIEPGSFKYKLRFLLSDVLVSSRSEYDVINPFGKELTFVKDLLDYDLVYLTHGTLFGDLASMLCKPVKNIALFCTSTKMEREALLKEEYGYSEDEVKVVGMARYDAYGNVTEKKKIVAFLPTWRSSIAGPIIPGTTTRQYVPHFAETEYCKFYNSLINNPRLIETMQRLGYKGEFYVHPAFEAQAADFNGNETIFVGSGSADYERVLSESSLLVTDYSGVGFDFGYQREPIVYCQFDSIFTQQHTYGSQSYFDYENDGFGPVAHTLDSIVDAIVRYLENGCVVEEKYKRRADKVFGFSDYNSCKRIFDSVVELEKTRCH